MTAGIAFPAELARHADGPLPEFAAGKRLGRDPGRPGQRAADDRLYLPACPDRRRSFERAVALQPGGLYAWNAFAVDQRVAARGARSARPRDSLTHHKHWRTPATRSVNPRSSRPYQAVSARLDK
jgi:hypothetical protein